MSDLNQNQQEAIDQAESEGFKVYRSDPTHLLIDLDTPEASRHFSSMFDRMLKNVEMKVENKWHSKSGTGVHVLIKLKEPIPEATTRLLLQSLLGSDAVKEYLSYLRYLDGNPEPCCLFRPRPFKSLIKKKVTSISADDDISY